MNRRFSAVFYDGQTSRPHDVTLDLHDSRIEFYPGDQAFTQRWAYSDIQNLDEAVAGRALNLTSLAAPEQRLVVHDLEAIYALVRLLPSRNRSLTRVPLTVPVVILLFVACIALVVSLPFAVKKAAVPLAHIIPIAWEDPLAPILVPEIEQARNYTLNCGGVAKQKELNKLVAALRGNDPAKRPVTVLISPDSEINAYALPGNIILVYEGLLKFIKTEQELSGILAHEIGHLERRHVMESLINQVGLRLVLAAMTGGSDSMAKLSSAGAGLFALGYSRDYEREADKSALEYLRKSHQTTDGLMAFLQRIEDKDSISKTLSKYELLSYLSTHPVLADRLEILRDGKGPKGKKAANILTSAGFRALKTPASACPVKQP